MTNSELDLFVVPLHRRSGQDQPYLPGLHIAAAPKRAARGRGEERLLMLLSLPAEINLSAEQQHNLLDDMAQAYFRTPGSVTSALREQAERLNSYFTQLNQKAGAKSQPSLAQLSMFSMHEQRATLAQCGPGHGFLLDGNEIRHFYDPHTAGRGLGLSNTTDIRFFQCELPAGSLLLMLPELPAGWNEKTLSDVQGQKLSTLRRRFLSEAGPDLRAALVAAQVGTGRFSLLSSLEPEISEPSHSPAEIPAKQSERPPRDPRSWEEVQIPEAEQPRPSDEQLAEAAPKQSPDVDEIPSWWKEISARLAVFGSRVLPPLRSFLLRMLPEEPTFSLPPQTLAWIAVLVPLAVVLVVSLVYLQFGRGQLYTNYLAQGQSAAAAAQAREDPAETRQAWEIAVYYAQRAVAYQEDDQAAAELLVQAQAALDEMDAIVRLDFQPALFEPLAKEVNITRLVATNTDLYMLNSTSGNILHAFLTGGGYQLDQDFHCEPGPYGSYIVSPLVDLALLPRGNSLNAVLVAMDENGNLIYCLKDERPLAVPLIPPDSNWGKPSAIAVENENLYVLDPLTNAVWIYFGEDYSFAVEPRFFFGAQVPSLHNILDLDLQDEQLFLLDLDGHIALCEFSDDLENPSTCQDPAEYTDSRPGRQNGAQISDAHFAQMQLSDPPEPSVFLLDPAAQSVYQFSQRLSLLRQFRALAPFPKGVVTAFAVSSNRAIFLAFENEIFIGFMP